MSLPLAILPGAIGGVAVVIVALLAIRWRRRRVAIRAAEDPDFELVFPEHPDEKRPRGTVTGRRVTRR